MRNSRSGILLLALLIALAVGLAVLGPLLVKKPGAVPPAPQAPAVTDITARGVVESERELQLDSAIAGTITEITVDKGENVSQGQALVLFDDRKVVAQIRRAQAGLREAKAQLTEYQSGYRQEDVDMAASRFGRAESIFTRAKDEYERQSRLYAKNAATLVDVENAEEKMKVAARELDEARANAQKHRQGARREEVDRAAAAVERANADIMYYTALLKDYTILSPLDGVVIERLREPQETVDKGARILTVIDPHQLRVRAELEETDIGRVSEGQRVEVTTDAYKGKRYTGKVSSVLPAVKKRSQRSFDPASSFDINTQEIRIALDDTAGLRSGLTVTVRFLK